MKGKHSGASLVDVHLCAGRGARGRPAAVDPEIV